MAYDRYDPRSDPRSDPRLGPREQARYPDERFRDREARERDREREERGFFERAGDEIASWFGDEEAESRRSRDERMGGRDDDFGRDYEPGRGIGRERERGRFQDRDEYRRTSLAGSPGRSQFDPHYQQWRQRQLDELDRDYDEYRREHQSKFEDDFGGWRERRQAKRQMLGQIREHMEVVGSDDEHVGTVDRVAGDRLILAKSDPDSGGAHHSLSCTEIGRIDGDRVILELPAEQAKSRWRDESRERALFEREDQGEAGPHSLERSFSGTYR